MADVVDQLLNKLAALISGNRWEGLETDTVEIKSVPGESASWRERHKSVNAFLNTRGGILILGVKEEGQGPARRWVLTGYREEAEEKLKEFHRVFTDRRGAPLDLREAFPAPQIREFQSERVAVVYVDELPADRKFAFYRGEAFKRVLTGDHRISEQEIESQEEYRQELWHARELQVVPAAGPGDIDLDVLNDYIHQINRPVKIETIKPDLESAVPFLQRKRFLSDGQVTALGMLVCGKHPGDFLGFRCHVHGYVDVPDKIAQDKQDLIGNILPLMESGLAYILRNIQIGVSIEAGGKAVPQYPEEVLRETLNNALAHRDYSIDKQAIISIKPGRHVAIRNPGSFRKHLLIDRPDGDVSILRIIPEAKARNPKLADVLRVYRKWEGKGIGMATLVNLCLENRIDLPTYRIHAEEVSLFLNAGRLVDERIREHLSIFDRWIRERLGADLTDGQLHVLSYLIKSEWANERQFHTILLTADNNHFEELRTLERNGVIEKHAAGSIVYPVFVPHRDLMKSDVRSELAAIFGDVSGLSEMARQCLQVLWRAGEYSIAQSRTARQTAFTLWHQERSAPETVREFEGFYRKVKLAFNRLEKSGHIVREKSGGRAFVLNRRFMDGRLL